MPNPEMVFPALLIVVMVIIILATLVLNLLFPAVKQAPAAHATGVDNPISERPSTLGSHTPQL